MSRPWRFIDYGSSTGAHNMAVDELLLERVATRAPVLRLYGWRPPAVSIGYNQSAATELDLERCRREGIDVVARPSGGRAVLHWNELTYSLLWAEDEPTLAGDVTASCRTIGECLVAGLRLFGVEAELEQGDRARAVSGARKPGSTPVSKGPCFASASRWEVTCGGKKLIGSAQRRTRGGALQHGSLLLGPEHLYLAALARAGGELGRTSTHLAEWVTPIDMARLTDCVVEGFSRTLGVSMRCAPLTAEEDATAAQRTQRFAAMPPQPSRPTAPEDREADRAASMVGKA